MAVDFFGCFTGESAKVDFRDCFSGDSVIEFTLERPPEACVESRLSVFACLMKILRDFCES